MTKQNQMMELCDSFLNSGLSRRDFCESHRISIRTFKYWQHKFDLKDKSQNFVRITTGSNKALELSSSEFALEYPNGVRLKTTAGIDLIRQLIFLV